MSARGTALAVAGATMIAPAPKVRAPLLFFLAFLAFAALIACGESASIDDATDTLPGPVPFDPVDGGGAQDASAPSFPSDAGADDGSPSGPVTGSVGTWTWFDVPGSTCGFGQQTGFAANIGTGSDILFYLEGGGLCWDEVTCQANVGGLNPASYFTSGYDRETFASHTPKSGIFDRTRADNPFKSSTMIYVPYCTGDFHSGTTSRFFVTAQKTAHWEGRKNLDLFLAKIVPSFPKASRITLAGTSAGGFGSLINYGHVRDAFAGKRVDLVSDSGPALWNNALIFAGLSTWNTTAALPKGCAGCAGNLRGLYEYYAQTYPDARLAVTTFDQDAAMSLGGYSLTPYPQFYDALRDLSVDTLKPLPNMQYFIAQGTEHGLLYDLDVVSQPHCCNNVLGICIPKTCGTAKTLGQWLTTMASNDPTWTRQTSIIE